MDDDKGEITLLLSVRRETSVSLQWGENFFFPSQVLALKARVFLLRSRFF